MPYDVRRSVYISGLPGTGKSHTVRAVVRALQSDERAVAPIAAYISCFSITDPNKIHAAVLNQLAIQAGEPAHTPEANKGCTFVEVSPIASAPCHTQRTVCCLNVDA